MSFRLLPAALVIASCSSAHAQILCVQCYDQDAPLNTSAPNLISNGSFELSNCTAYPDFGEIFCPASFGYNCDLQDWFCTGGGSSTYAMLYDHTICNIPDGLVGAYFGNNFCRLCSDVLDDTSCVQMDGCIATGFPEGYPVNTPVYGGNAGVSLWQTVTGLVPNSTYILEFWAGGEDFDNFSHPGVFAVSVGFGRTFLRCKPTEPGETGTRYQVIFIAEASSHTITFTSWGYVISGLTELVLDDVRLIAASSTPCGSTQISAAQVEPDRLLITGEDIRVDATGYAHARLSLYDIAGRILLAQAITGVQHLSLAHLPPGVISYQLSANGEHYLGGRLVKL